MKKVLVVILLLFLIGCSERPITTKWTDCTLSLYKINKDVEIGLRSDGVLVYRDKENKTLGGNK